MFGHSRLAKEDYALMGRSQVWPLQDAVALLTSFEMEASGSFGETGELFEFNRIDFRKPLEGIEGKYYEARLRWVKILHCALWDGDILYSNIPERDEMTLDLPEGAGKTITGTGSFTIDELLNFLANSVETGNLELDLKMLCDFLSGKGLAPARDVQVVEIKKIIEKEKRVVEIVQSTIEIEKVVEVEKVVKEPMDKSDMGAALASGRNAVPKAKVEIYVNDLFSKGCTCWHNVMRDHVQAHFNAVENGNTLIPEKERVARLTKTVLLRELKRIYTDCDRKDLIFDKTKHGGQRNTCALHGPSK